MNTSALTARQIIDNGFNALDGSGNDGSGNDGSGNDGSGSGWNWGAFWNAFTHLGDSAVDMWGRPKPSNYPSQYPPQSTISPLVTYGILAVVVLLALALMAKILK